MDEVVGGGGSWLIQRRQSAQFVGHPLASRYQVGHESRIDFEHAFVLAKVASIVAFGKHPPNLRPQAQGVR